MGSIRITLVRLSQYNINLTVFLEALNNGDPDLHPRGPEKQGHLTSASKMCLMKSGSVDMANKHGRLGTGLISSHSFKHHLLCSHNNAAIFRTQLLLS